MSNRTNTQNGGIGFFGLLGILFIGLKLTGFITWSWWLVLLPIYGPLAFVLGMMILFGSFALLFAAIMALFGR